MNGNEPTLEEAREIFNKDQFATKARGVPHLGSTPRPCCLRDAD